MKINHIMSMSKILIDLCSIRQNIKIKKHFCSYCLECSRKKVRHHDHITGKYRDSAHSNGSINLILTKKVPITFHNLIDYDGYLIMQEISKFDVKICAIPNGLEKYMAFVISKSLVFIDSMQVMSSSLDRLDKTLIDNDFKYLSERFIKISKTK